MYGEKGKNVWKYVKEMQKIKGTARFVKNGTLIFNNTHLFYPFLLDAVRFRKGSG